MTLAQSLLLDFDLEAISTRRILERIPNDKGDWKPHEKSMALGRLATHVAQLPLFGNTILSTPELDLGAAKFPSLTFTSAEDLVTHAAGAGAELRTLLAGLSDDDLQTDWTLRWGDNVIATGPRALLYRSMFFNHLIHHRAQLTVYLRLLDIPVPGLYGPSADEPFAAPPETVTTAVTPAD